MEASVDDLIVSFVILFGLAALVGFALKRTLYVAVAIVVAAACLALLLFQDSVPDPFIHIGMRPSFGRILLYLLLAILAGLVTAGAVRTRRSVLQQKSRSE